ncbi:MAG: 1-acyl-sn-glycerol-3-phosphate acyltransferase [Lentimonas sp.]|jgi:1-acyl-sn-glycerol-3-phosphate acyltransferase
MGKGEILKYPIIGTYFKNLNVPVHRGSIIKSAMAYRQAKSLIEEGYSLVIFPEGGIPDHNPSKVGNFKNGAFRLAADTGVKIQPISIINHYKLFSDLSDFFGKARPGISSFYFHPEMSVLRDEIYNQKETCREIIQKGLNNHH